MDLVFYDLVWVCSKLCASAEVYFVEMRLGKLEVVGWMHANVLLGDGKLMGNLGCEV